MAAVTYFYYYGPGRVVVREGDVAEAMYFIITGAVVISQMAFDPILNKVANQDIALKGPGGIFGEISLLHDTSRTSTVTTKSKLV